MTVTTRHKLLAENVGKYGSMTKDMQESKYRPSYADSGNIKHTQGWQELMAKNLKNEKILKRLDEGLDATKIQTSPTEPDKEVIDYGVRHKYVETALRVKGHLQNEMPEMPIPQLTQNILVLINKVYGKRTEDAANSERLGMP